MQVVSNRDKTYEQTTLVALSIVLPSNGDIEHCGTERILQTVSQSLAYTSERVNEGIGDVRDVGMRLNKLADDRAFPVGSS
jgi:hypothetical protein